MDEWRSFLVSFVGPGRIGPVQVKANVQARRPEEAMDRALARYGLSQETYDGEVIVTQHRRREQQVDMCECGHSLQHPIHVRGEDTWAITGGCRYCADCHREPVEPPVVA